MLKAILSPANSGQKEIMSVEAFLGTMMRHFALSPFSVI